MSIGARMRRAASGLLTTDPGDPGDLPVTTDLFAHYDATELTLSDLDPVTTWPDVSGNSRDVTQTTAARRPQYIASGLNGLPAVRFEGTDIRHLDGDDPVSLKPASLFIVGTWSDVGSTRPIFSGHGGDGAYIIFNLSTGRYALQADSVAVITSTGNNTIVADAAAVWGSTLTGDATATARLYKNTDLVSGPSSTSATISSRALRIGSRNAESNWHSGDIAEIAVYTRVLTDTERGDVISHLMTKWGLT